MLGVVRRGLAGLTGAVRGDEAPFRLVGGPLQARERPGEPALDGQHTLAAGQAGVLAGARALDDHDVAVLEALQGDRAQERGAAAAGFARDQQMRLRGADPRAPDDRGNVTLFLAIGEGSVRCTSEGSVKPRTVSPGAVTNRWAAMSVGSGGRTVIFSSLPSSSHSKWYSRPRPDLACRSCSIRARDSASPSVK